MNIKTSHWAKPIPTRNFDWSAVDDDTYDGEGSPVGHGATEPEAVNDLLSQIEAKAPATPHTQDSNCDVDPNTLCCKVCGVEHGAACNQCGGRGFHKPTCPSQKQDVNAELLTALKEIEQLPPDSLRIRLIAQMAIAKAEAARV